MSCYWKIVGHLYVADKEKRDELVTSLRNQFTYFRDAEIIPCCSNSIDIEIDGFGSWNIFDEVLSDCKALKEDLESAEFYVERDDGSKSKWIWQWEEEDFYEEPCVEVFSQKEAEEVFPRPVDYDRLVEIIRCTVASIMEGNVVEEAEDLIDAYMGMSMAELELIAPDIAREIKGK